MLTQVSLELFRCFCERQTVRLAPQTLLVKRYATETTSFLAMIQSLWHGVMYFRAPALHELPQRQGASIS